MTTTDKPSTSEKDDNNKNSCTPDISAEEQALRDGRKSLTMPGGKNAKNKIRYVEGTTPLKDGCWLSE